MKIVLDTNDLLATLPTKSPYHNIWTRILEGKLTLCVSNDILLEYEEVISDKTNSHFASNIIKTLLNLQSVEIYDPHFAFRLIEQDHDDDKFTDCAIASNADAIITEDKHFDILEKIEFPKILRLRIKEAIKILKSENYNFS